MSDAERQRKRRAKRTEEQKKQANVMSENSRKKRLAKMTQIELNEYKKKAKIRQQKSRERKAAAKDDQGASTPSPSSSSVSPGYLHRSTRARAIQRLLGKMPNSPTKQRQVVGGLAKRFGMELEEKASNNVNNTNPRVLAEEIRQSISEFYFRTDLVYTAPGKDDFVTVREKGEKLKKRKYYLTVFLREAFAMFKELNPDVKIGFSKFCELRPTNVLLLKETPHEVCKCQIHEDFMYKLKGLGVSYDTSFVKNHICDESMDSACWQNECDLCKDAKKLKANVDLNGRECFYKEWDKDDKGFLRLVIRSAEDHDLFALIEACWGVVIRHIMTKRIQETAFEQDKNDKEVTALQFDFAMSYSCSYQDEIQSAMWTRESVNLFTAAMYAKDQPCKSFLVVTDSNDKGKGSIYAFLHEIMKKTKSLFKDSKYFVFYTDGPSSEFKNRFAMKMLNEFSVMYNIEMRWQYFATSHGKGVVDGIGGSSKAIVRKVTQSKHGNCVVQSSKDYFEVSAKHLKNVQHFHITQENIDHFLEKDFWENTKEIIGISKVHTAVCLEGCLKVFKNNFEFCAKRIMSIIDMDSHKGSKTMTKQNLNNIEKGDWVVVVYDNKHYPGEVTDIGKNQLEVSVMHSKTGRAWSWPEREDKIVYAMKDIIKKVRPPVPTDRRSHFRFEDDVLM